jgi:GR25 family glycosyltransferase involved in LPS biosynthesis
MHLDAIPIVCISLDRRPDRWATFKARADVAGLPVERLSAVDAKEFVAHKHPAVSVLTSYNIENKVRRSGYEIDAPGAVGASLSHFKAWNQLRESSAPAMLIFEDDADLPADLKLRLEQLLTMLPADWDMIQLQRTKFEGGFSGCKPVTGPGNNGWQTCTSLSGAFAYIVSRQGAEKLLAKAYPIDLHVDAYMAFMSKQGFIRMMWHPLIDIPYPDQDSDIGHGSQGIVNIPTDMEKEWIYALELQTVIGLMAMSAVVGGLVAIAYVGRK